MRNPHAVLVVPRLAGDRIRDPGLVRWLSRGTVARDPAGCEVLDRVLAALDVEPPAAGRAALRYLGQTGQMPETFVCAADPVHLETRMRDLVLHDLPDDGVTEEELARLFRTLDERLGGDDGLRFVARGRCGYVLRHRPFDTAGLSAAAADGSIADRYMPSGESARDHHRLQGEVQMILHEHDVNRRRDAEGRPAINALWFWGGGPAAPAGPAGLPPLWADDGLLTGFWRQSGAEAKQSCATLPAIDPGSGFVAETASPDREPAEAVLRAARSMMTAGRIGRLSVIARDRVTIVVRRRDRFRIWRRASPLLELADGRA